VLGIVDALDGPTGRREDSRQHPGVEQLVGSEHSLVATRERLTADRMEEREPAVGSGRVGEGPEQLARVGHVGEEAGGEEEVDAIGRHRQAGHVGEYEPGPRVLPVTRCGLEHLRCRVDSHDESVVTDGALQEGERAPGAAAEVDDDGARFEKEARDRVGVSRPVVGKTVVPACRARTEELACTEQMRFDQLLHGDHELGHRRCLSTTDSPSPGGRLVGSGA
jgi:hypothetical protein